MFLPPKSGDNLDEPMPDSHFKVMTFLMKIRDLFSPRAKVLAEVGIKPGFKVLDYGCGPGAYVTDGSKLVGQNGKYFALDIHPLAIQKVKDIIRKKKLTNVETIITDCKTNLPDNSLDAVLLYDIYHLLSKPGNVLKEIHRVLKPIGELSVSDHHLTDSEVRENIERSGIFKFASKGKKTFTFKKK
jgi:ubiquinone/menaquinone biosynthesis C-methylase UbiE